MAKRVVLKNLTLEELVHKVHAEADGLTGDCQRLLAFLQEYESGDTLSISEKFSAHMRNERDIETVARILACAEGARSQTDPDGPRALAMVMHRVLRCYRTLANRLWIYRTLPPEQS
jgi:hypothetical protein